MYVPNVPNVFISDLSQMTLGMELWSVGQGGICTLQEPTMIGTLTRLNKRYGPGNEIRDDLGSFMYLRNPDAQYESSRSYIDAHIGEQQYNNWYICASKEAADTIYAFLKDAWETNPEHEQERMRFKHECDEMDKWIPDF
jgi:hypothetical protein